MIGTEEEKNNMMNESESNIDFLTQTATELFDFSSDDNIYAYIVRSLKKVTPPGTIILANSIEPDKKTVTLQAFEGLNPYLPQIEAMLGCQLIGISFSLPDPAMIPLRTGTCDELEGGLLTLTFGGLPKDICTKIEQMPFFGKIYGTGISWKGVLHGVTTFILPPGFQLENPKVISLFIRQVAGYLQRRSAEKIIEDQYTTLQGIIESSNSPIFSVDTGYIYTSFNDSHKLVMKELYGAEIELGYNILEYQTVAEDRIKARMNLDRALKGEHFLEMAYSGEERKKRLYFEVSHNPIRNIRGIISGVAVYAHDTTERQKNEMSLRESEATAKALLNATNESALLIDTHGIILAANTITANRLGWNNIGEIIGKSAYSVLPPELKTSRQQLVQNVIRTGETVQFEDIRLGRIIENNISPILDKNREVFRLAIYGRDITERKKNEEQIIKLSNLKEKLLEATDLEIQLKMISDAMIDIFDADFARIWLVDNADLCYNGCVHASVIEGPDVCRNRDHCLHLKVSSGRYTHINGNHQRVPLGCYKIGRVASGEEPFFITNDASNDPQVHDHGWARSLGLVSFAGFRILSDESKLNGVMALFRKTEIVNREEKLLLDLANTLSYVVNSGIARTALMESEELFRISIEKAPEAILLFDVNLDRYVEANVSAEQLFGCSRQQLLDLGPQQFYRHYQPDLRQFSETVTEHRQHALAGEKIIFERYIRNARDEDLVIEVRLIKLQSTGRTLIRSSFIDITNRKNAEEALKESENRYRSFVQSFQGIAYLSASNWIPIFFNGAVEEITGYTEQDFITGNPRWDQIIHPLDLIMIQQRDNEKLLTNINCSIQREYRIFTKKGQIKWISDFIQNRIDENSELFLSGILMDITERKIVERALKQANHKLNLLSGITRHDIRNQLTALNGYLEISRNFINDTGKILEFITKEEHIAETISRQIDFTKDYEEMGIKAPIWQSVSNIVRDVTSRLPMRNILVDIGDPDIEIFGDPLLEKVFYNLIDNALRYGGEQMTNIRINNHNDERGYLILFEDDGDGISIEDKQKLFTKGFGKNTGLGLYLSREILAITGMTIQDTGKSGMGAQFEITVPNGKWRFEGQ